jgi:DNA ligase (NAD+)
MEADVEQITAIPGLGEKIAVSVRDFFDRDDARDMVERLRAAGVNLREESGGAREGPLSGLTIVITGRLDVLSRNEAERLCKRNGAAVGSSVSKKTDFLVVGEDAGSKLAKAEKLGVKTLDEEAFIAFLRERGVELP